MELAEKTRQVRAMLRRGVPDGEIREDLRREGYSEADIRTIFKPRRYDMRNYYLIAAIGVILGGIRMLPGLLGILILLIGGLTLYEYRRECVRVQQEQEKAQ